MPTSEPRMPPSPGMVTPQTATDSKYLLTACQWLCDRPSEYPDPNAIAYLLSLEEAALHSLVQRWLGVQPENFWAMLTPQQLRSRLQPTLAASMSDGAGELPADQSPANSMPVQIWGRSATAMGNGDQAALAYGVHPTAFGLALIAVMGRGICHVEFLEAERITTAVHALEQRWPHAQLSHDQAFTQAACDRLQALMHPTASVTQPIPLILNGTDFQVRVWRALMRIPFGRVVTYQALAQAIGQPQAARAVGTAVGRNAIAYLVPCHRVIRTNGQPGGYRWGPARKLLMLGWEARQWQARTL